MADNVYEFNFYNREKDGAKTAVAQNIEDKKQQKDTADASKAVLGAIMVIDKVKPYVRQIQSSKINIVEIQTGKNEYAEQLRLNQQIGNFLFDTTESIVAGTFVGGVPGAVVGAMVSVGSKAFSIALKQQEITAARSVEDIQRGIMAQRIGYSGSRGREQ